MKKMTQGAYDSMEASNTHNRNRAGFILITYCGSNSKRYYAQLSSFPNARHGHTLLGLTRPFFDVC